MGRVKENVEDEPERVQEGVWRRWRVEIRGIVRPTVQGQQLTLSVAVLPPVLGPVMMTARVSGLTHTSIATGPFASTAASSLLSAVCHKHKGIAQQSDMAVVKVG